MLRIGALFMALHILFVSLGMNVNFHYCSEDHHLMSSFGDASELCEHCLGHHHHSHMDAQEFEEHLSVMHFGAECCCEDFESTVGFSEGFVFSTEKQVMMPVLGVLLPSLCDITIDQVVVNTFHVLSLWKIPNVISGRLRTIIFSNLKLNPLVF